MSETAITKAPAQGEPELKGWLFKWTNYLKGYQRRWFVLSNGLLSYYRNQAEMTHTCRGTISLHGALIHTVDSCTFVISNGGTQTFHIKAASEVERQSWVTALELAKDKAIRAMESEDDDDAGGGGETPREDINSIVRELNARLEDLQTCSELISKHGAALQRSLTELEQIDDIQLKSKALQERATLFRIASNAMLNACNEYLAVAQTQGQKWYKMLQHEREQKLRLEEVVEQLARQHSNLEKAASQHAQRPNVNIGSGGEEEEEENEFFDCVADSTSHHSSISGAANSSANNMDELRQDHNSTFILNIPVNSGSTSTASPYRRNESEGSSSEPEEIDTKQVLVRRSGCASTSNDLKEARVEHEMMAPTSSKTNRRTRVPDKPYYPLNLWSIMKNCIGKDLSKIPMPVNFSEPLSMLQRLTEDYEYADILDAAARCEDACEQLAYVAAFTVSAYSTTSDRTGKPFNPLLGETYECDRTTDLGWRVINEQVSHHPPMVAQFCEGHGWRCWQEFTMSSKFRGKYLQVIPLGNSQVEFTKSKNRYTWRKVTTTVHNIIVGKLWVDQHGDMDIIGQGASEGIKCHLKYIPYSYFTRDSQRRVKGYVMNAEQQVKWVVSGTWDNSIEIAEVTSCSGSSENMVCETGPCRVIWKRRMPPEDSDKYYNFTLLACQLNEPEDGVAPTDSRNRPDQRLMENGEWDAANTEKIRLEEKQRSVRRQRELEAEEAAEEGKPYPNYEPIWFKKQEDELTGNVCHVYQGQYWKCKQQKDWSMCPDIF